MDHGTLTLRMAPTQHVVENSEMEPASDSGPNTYSLFSQSLAGW